MKQILIRVRSMSTAAYVGVGNLITQDVQLVAAGQLLSFSPASSSELSLDVSSIFVSCDAGSPVIEIIGEAV